MRAAMMKARSVFAASVVCLFALILLVPVANAQVTIVHARVTIAPKAGATGAGSPNTAVFCDTGITCTGGVPSAPGTPVWDLTTPVHLNGGQTLVLTQTGFIAGTFIPNFDTSDRVPQSPPAFVDCNTTGNKACQVTIELDTTDDAVVNLVTVYNSGAADDVIVKSNVDTGADALCEGAAWVPHTIAPVNYTLATGYADNVHGTVTTPCNFKPSPFSDATVFKGAGTPPVQGRCLAGTSGGCYDAGAILITAVNVGCTLTQGFWKTHGPIPTGNNSNEWPTDLNPAAGVQTSMTLGTRTYTPLELQAILDTPVAGNGLISLAHQLIAAKINIQNGANGSAIAATITAADALIGNLDIDGGGYLKPSQVGSLVSALTDFNEGTTGPGHCGPDSDTD